MIRLEEVSRSFRARGREVAALRGVNAEIAGGEFALVSGPSGSGKSTLLFTLGGMLRPSSGRVVLEGFDLYAIPSGRRAALRASKVGLVFQMFHLVPYLTVLENALLQPGRDPARRARAQELIERLGLRERADHRPAQLSAGERQRAALARALAGRPAVILADEPTGNLDEQNGAEVLQILSEFHRGGGTVILATHGSGAERFATQRLRLREGKLEGAQEL